jgi:hypothetical protein
VTFIGHKITKKNHFAAQKREKTADKMLKNAKAG